MSSASTSNALAAKLVRHSDLVVSVTEQLAELVRETQSPEPDHVAVDHILHEIAFRVFDRGREIQELHNVFKVLANTRTDRGVSFAEALLTDRIDP